MFMETALQWRKMNRGSVEWDYTVYIWLIFLKMDNIAVCEFLQHYKYQVAY